MFKLTQIVLGVLLVGFLFMLRPPALGGNANYITVRQAGLEPLLYEDDLAIVKQQGEYATGDLVAVETQQGSYFGRILAQDEQAYQVRLFVGAEPVAVSQEYVLGRLWINVGNFGRRISGSVLGAFKISAEAAQ